MEEKPTYDEMLKDLWDRVQTEIHKPKHIQCYDGRWFFWDETLTQVYGPYETMEEAQEESKKYAETIGHIVGPKETAEFIGFERRGDVRNSAE